MTSEEPRFQSSTAWRGVRVVGLSPGLVAPFVELQCSPCPFVGLAHSPSWSYTQWLTLMIQVIHDLIQVNLAFTTTSVA